MYRATSSLVHSEFEPYGDPPAHPSRMSPNGYTWPNFPVKDGCDWTEQKLVAQNGDPAAKHGTAIWIFAITKDMKRNTVMSSLDGDQLIILQAGALDVDTECGGLLVRQNEFVMIPRGLRYRVTLASESAPARGYV